MLKTIFHIITSCLAEQNIAVRENSTFFMQKKKPNLHILLKKEEVETQRLVFYIQNEQCLYQFNTDY